MSSPPAANLVSVVIPTLDEAATLAPTLHALERAVGAQRFEVIVVDGGSTDGTLEVARAGGCLCLSSTRRQRAAQMNAGAAHAGGAALLFLHADTLLPPGGLAQIVAVLRTRPEVVGGGFSRRYDSPARWLRFTCWLAGWRNRWFGWHLGDQAIFVRRTIFEHLGGFRDLSIFEDVDFSRRLGRTGTVVTLQPPVVSSARRFAGRGPFRTSLADFALTLRYLARGAGPSGR